MTLIVSNEGIESVFTVEECLKVPEPATGIPTEWFLQDVDP